MKETRGRPSTYTQEIADTICERIAEGESLRTICRDAHMPARSSVFKWLSIHTLFADHYARARIAQADALAEQILEIADETSHDTITKTNADGSEYKVPDSEWIARSRLRVDSRKWLASKMAPKKYGERLDLGNADGKPFETSDTHLADRMAAIIATARGRKAAEEAGGVPGEDLV